MSLWPQWRSALVWDFWAIGSYLIFSILFWYMGAIPDLATVRDRASTTLGRTFYGILALGWNGSAGQWHRYEAVYKATGALGTPLVVAVHSVVGLDFAASLMPGWQESIFPPYFVVGALFSGFATVIVIAILVRWGLGLQSLITDRHFDAMGKILLASSVIMAYSYMTEWYLAWYGSGDAERTVVAYAFTGDYAWFYRTLLFFNCVLPQIFWFPSLRRRLWVLLGVCLLIDVGMWLERILIIFNTLARGYLPSMWRTFHPTLWDWTLLFTPFGFFAFMILLFCRLAPMVAIHEVRQIVHEEGRG
jgi:molybdopterin-containing oxidoreductase family membrane subunit